MVYSNTAVCGVNELGKSGHLTIFTYLKHLCPVYIWSTIIVG